MRNPAAKMSAVFSSCAACHCTGKKQARNKWHGKNRCRNQNHSTRLPEDAPTIAKCVFCAPPACRQGLQKAWWRRWLQWVPWPSGFACCAEKVNSYNFLPQELEATDGNGCNAWVDNLDFFDKAKPKDEPQCIALYIRRQDGDLPKKNFMDLFHSQFNLNVLAKMVGEPAKKINGINAINASLAEVKVSSKTNQSVISSYNYSFENSSVNQFPTGWNGMKNITVQQYENKNWLAFIKDGYWYPQQFNKEISSNFNLSFDISWNKDIAYNSGLFTVSFSEIDYDNAGERYKMDENQNQYWSFYDSYVGKFNRVVLWFDPYANGGGTLTVYSYDKNESIVVNKRITLPNFYLTKNKHQIKIQRKGNALLVFINDNKEAELENVFLPSVKYNLYTFSRYKGNNSDNKNDVFYLANINTVY